MISFILTLILFVSFLLLICFIIGPELIHSLKEIVKLAPNAYDQLLIFLKENRNIMNGSFKNIIDSIISLDLDLSALYKTIINNWQSLFHSGFSILSNTLSSLYTFFIGLVFSIYLLFSKETLSKQLKKTTIAFIGKNKTDKICKIIQLSSDTFFKFYYMSMLRSLYSWKYVYCYNGYFKNALRYVDGSSYCDNCIDSCFWSIYWMFYRNYYDWYCKSNPSY